MAPCQTVAPEELSADSCANCCMYVT